MRNTRLAVLVAAVAVAAVAIGAVAAAGRGPHDDAAAAVPLTVSSAQTKATAPVRRTPPSTVKIDLKTLSRGAAPHVTYVRDRTVLGGDAAPVEVPGKTEIVGAGRLHDAVLTIQLRDVRTSSLVVLDASGKQIGQVAGVDSLVTSPDGESVAYASGGRYAPDDAKSSTGEIGAGGTVYFQRSVTEPAEILPWPDVYDLEVLGVTDHTVYFRAGKFEEPWHLYKWEAGQRKATLLGKVVSPTVVASDGSLAAGLTVFNDSGMCTALMAPTTGTKLWRSCQYQLTHLSPGNVFAVAVPPGSAPYGEVRMTALDVKTSNKLREWTGPSLRGSAVEDDDHLLLQWHDQDGPTSRSALVRCAVSTGVCELATPLASGPLVIGS